MCHLFFSLPSYLVHAAQKSAESREESLPGKRYLLRDLCVACWTNACVIFLDFVQGKKKGLRTTFNYITPNVATSLGPLSDVHLVEAFLLAAGEQFLPLQHSINQRVCRIYSYPSQPTRGSCPEIPSSAKAIPGADTRRVLKNIFHV